MILTTEFFVGKKNKLAIKLTIEYLIDSDQVSSIVVHNPN